LISDSWITPNSLKYCLEISPALAYHPINHAVRLGLARPHPLLHITWGRYRPAKEGLGPNLRPEGQNPKIVLLQVETLALA
jgi:hypothetical protein